ENGSNFLNYAGAVYIFSRNGSIWTQQQKLVASDRQAYMLFGNTVSLRGDYLAISCPLISSSAGAVYLFHQSEGSWTEKKIIQSSDIATSDFFGASVSLGDDFLFVGAQSESEDENGANTMS